MKLRSNKRFRGSLWSAAAVCGVLAINAPATITKASQGDAAQGPVARTSVPVVPPHIQEVRKALSGMVVSIDPATGEFRAPTPEEHEALTGTSGARAAFAAPQVVDLPGGGSAVLTGAASIDFVTAVTKADGTVTFRCTHGLDATSRTTFSAAHGTPSRDVRHDRFMDILFPGSPFQAFAFFNSQIGQAGCLPTSGWYYGLDTSTPTSRINLVTVLLHEFGHGLGFTVGPTNANTGARAAPGPGLPGLPSIWESTMADLSVGKTWLQMSDAERFISARNTTNLVWQGVNTTTAVPTALGPGTEWLVRINHCRLETSPAHCLRTLPCTRLGGGRSAASSSFR